MNTALLILILILVCVSSLAGGWYLYKKNTPDNQNVSNLVPVFNCAGSDALAVAKFIDSSGLIQAYTTSVPCPSGWGSQPGNDWTPSIKTLCFNESINFDETVKYIQGNEKLSAAVGRCGLQLVKDKLNKPLFTPPNPPGVLPPGVTPPTPPGVPAPVPQAPSGPTLN